MILGKVQVPASVKAGEPFEVRVLIQHPMETGFRRDLEGRAIPVHIVDKVWCTLAGKEVFRAEFGTGMSANPYVAFFATASEGGELVVQWSDDRGDEGRASALVDVSPA
ncbi:MAG TPA: thiosulfate oxidation carrier complex protein SoxZ [Usitatibacter sp.]|nr:thiosulfate oxidation carrier complex protein SoxZ [Usitatibacter sp.]